MKIKVCGMRDPENIKAVAALAPDFMGFIFYKGSSRFVGDDFVVPSDFPTSIERVGVFVNATIKYIMDTVKRNKLSFAQLHGGESFEECLVLKENGLGVIKVFSVGNDFDFSVTNHFADAADYFLFDTKGAKFGGNGIPFDWNILRQYKLSKPFFVSGGLSVNNFQKALDLKPVPFGLDLNSGVELSPGVKDISLVKKIIDTKSI